MDGAHQRYACQKATHPHKDTLILQVPLGNTGLTVSELALGCMTYGDPKRGLHTWTLTEDQSQPFFKQAIELGITHWDTANVYQQGTSEEFVGRAVKRYSRREHVQIATKVWGRMHDGPTGAGLSAPAIREQLDASLARLETDYIDLYYIHRFDAQTPVEETMEALHAAVTAGKVRALGASSMFAWQFAKLQTAAAVNGWTPFAAMQNQYNLIKREDERELIPMCADMGVSLVPYSPLGKGRLTRPWGAQTARSSADAVAETFDSPHDAGVIDALQRVAAAREVPMAHVALAWVRSHGVVASPIIGATKPHHLADAVAGLDVTLTAAELEELEAPYVPQAPYWY